MEAVDVRYCSCCGWPVHYCKYRKPSKQAELGCEAVLKREDEALWALVYPHLNRDDVNDNAPDKVESEGPEQHEKTEEEAEESEEEGEEEEDAARDNGITCFAYDKAKFLPSVSR